MVTLVATMRGTRSILAASRAIQRSREPHLPLEVHPGERRWARAMQYVEWMHSKLISASGEEIALVALRD